MATWVRTPVGLPRTSATNSDLAIPSSNGITFSDSAPADFDPTAVSQVQVVAVFSGSGFAGDTWAIGFGTPGSIGINTSTGNTIAGGSPASQTGLGNETASWNYTDTTILTTYSTTQWENMEGWGSGGGTATGNVTEASRDMGPDGYTTSLNSLTVTITYTPLSGDRKARVSWAELEVPTAPRKARLSWAELEVPEPSILVGKDDQSVGIAATSITFSKPAGTTTGDLMVAWISHESGSSPTWTPPSGWTQIGSDIGNGTNNAAVWYRVAGASEPSTYQWDYVTANEATGTLIVHRGVEVGATAITADMGSTYSESVTTTDADSWLLAMGGQEYSATPTTHTQDSGPSLTKQSDHENPSGGPLGVFAFSGPAGATGLKTVAISSASSGNPGQMQGVLIEMVPASTDRTARMSWTELEVPTAPRTAQVSWAELEIPDGARTAKVTWAELELPDGARRAQVSWAELEVPSAPRRARVSWAELEAPTAPRSAQVSWAEFEVPDAPRSALVTWAELEIPTAPRRARVAWTELEVGDAPRRAQVSWAELETPSITRSALLTWAELEIPTAPRAAQVVWVEMELPDAARAAQVVWAELEVPDGARSALVSWAEFELPTAPRRALVSWAEFEVPAAPRSAQLSWAELELPDTPGRSAILIWTELQLPDAPGVDTRTGSKRIMMTRVQ